MKLHNKDKYIRYFESRYFLVSNQVKIKHEGGSIPDIFILKMVPYIVLYNYRLIFAAKLAFL